MQSRSRFAALAVLLSAPLVPATTAAARTPALTTTERSQLLALMSQRHHLVETLVAANRARGQALTFAALAAANAMLTSDVAALRRQIVRLSWHPHPADPLAVLDPPVTAAAVAAPGTLWSPTARVTTPRIGLRPDAPALGHLHLIQGRASRTHLAPLHVSRAIVPLAPEHPLASSLATLTSWTALLPAASGQAVPAAALAKGQPVRTTALSAQTRGQDIPATDPAAAALSYGGYRLDPGTGTGSIAASAINARVSAAALVPVVEQSTQSRAAAVAALVGSDAAPAAAAVVPSIVVPSVAGPSRDALLRRWHALSAALVQVRAAQAWAASTSPTASIQASDVITNMGTLTERLDTWTARVETPSVPPAAVPVFMTATQPAPLPAVGATFALSTGLTVADTPITATGSAASSDGSLVTATGTLASGTASYGALTSQVVDAAPLVAVAGSAPVSAISVPVALADLPPFTTTTPATVPVAVATSAAGVDQTVVAGAATPTGALVTPTPAAFASPPAAQETGTPVVGGIVAITTTAPLTPAVSLTTTVAGGSSTSTLVLDASGPRPPALVVTLPPTALTQLAPDGYAAARSELDSVVAQGQALFTRLTQGQTAAEADYRARLGIVANENAAIESQWNARLYVYNGYLNSLTAWQRRIAAYNGYAQRRHASLMRFALWQQQTAAWTLYAQRLHAYSLAVQAAAHAPQSPISSTLPAAQTTLPPKPLPPVYPGSEPPPFAELPPAWPGAAPAPVSGPGLRPFGYALPDPPPAIPPWDGVSLPDAVIRFGGPLYGVDPNGIEETTQRVLLAAGALDGVNGYQDPLKGQITTYWGGSTIFQSFHAGVDIAAGLYTPIHAAAAGIVTAAGYAVAGQRHESYGLCVVIKHNNHYSTLYAHMDDQRFGLQVRVGDLVQQGQTIGVIGLTGWTTGPHLHFEMRQDNVQFDPLLLIPNPQA